ncbi:MAG: alpha/beta hydrolase [Lachnospiraceae bacterium]|nr:alpha/beta hydrolase [Lachnospiraceae bacterium]
MRPEDNYPRYIEERVLPYILPRREERYLSREPGREIYCAFYTADGTVAEKNGTPKGIILISHGFTETADKYFEVIFYFLKAGYHVCIPEHCGHGRSYRLVKGDVSLVHTDSWERYVEDLNFIALSAKQHWFQAVLNREAISGSEPRSAADRKGGGVSQAALPLFLFAHSMGGGIGAALSARKPDLFDKVILSSPMIRPATGPVPWQLTKLIVAVMCALGKEQEYVIGQHPYDGKETFEVSFATSPARHAWYKEKTDAEPLFQTSGASYGWLREAIRLNDFLMKKAWQQIRVPVLLIQAEKETVVSKKQQVQFIQRLSRAARFAADRKEGGTSKAALNREAILGSELRPAADRKGGGVSKAALLQEIRFVRVPGAKHEIYRSDDQTLAKYLKGCLNFLL